MASWRGVSGGMSGDMKTFERVGQSVAPTSHSSQDHHH